MYKMSSVLETTIRLAKSEHGGKINLLRCTEITYNTKIPGVNPTFADYSTDVIQSEGPVGRFGHYAINVGDYFYMFGGITINSTYLNDMWKLDMTTGLWTKINPTASTPSLRAYGIIFSIDKNIYIHGGYDGINGFNDLYEFNTELHSWKLLNTTGTENIIRWAHTGALYNNNILYITTGITTGDIILKDTIKLNLTTMTWSGECHSTPVSNASMVEVNGNLYLFYGFFGGSKSKVSDIIYITTIDPITYNISSWSKFIVPNGIPPSSRGLFTLYYYNNYIYFYGGTATPVESITDQILDNAYRLDLTPGAETWTEYQNILGPYKRKGCTLFAGIDGLYIFGGLIEYPSLIFYADIWKVLPVVSPVITASEEPVLIFLGQTQFTHNNYIFKCFSINGIVWVSISVPRKHTDMLKMYSLRINV